ncbi:hypothetical protein ACJX0J_034496, partial [Zea mays]
SNLFEPNIYVITGLCFSSELEEDFMNFFLTFGDSLIEGRLIFLYYIYMIAMIRDYVIKERGL